MKKSPRGLRNNNPGNIRNSDATDWQGEVPANKKKDNSFEEFEDMAHGYRALIKLLQNYRRKYGCQTIADFISRWAPRTENNTSGYISRVCKEDGHCYESFNHTFFLLCVWFGVSRM